MGHFEPLSTSASCSEREGLELREGGQKEVSHEPGSESAPAWADGSEERKPEGEGRDESQPDLER
jgi:hypothetical protein